MPYEKVRFIAHCLYTAPNHVWNAQSGGWKEQYNGDKNHDTDIQKRVAFVENAIAKALKELESQDSKDTLKIFMMPECFFQGGNGAYPVGEETDKDNKVRQVIEKLQGLVKDKKWSDWVFVFGSVNGVYKLGTHDEVFNVVLVQKGGYGDEEAHKYCFLAQKVRFDLDLISSGKMEGGGLAAEQVGLGFGTTENEEIFAHLIRMLLKDEDHDKIEKQIVSVGGKGWETLKSIIEAAIKERGETVIARSIRNSEMPEKCIWNNDWKPIAKKVVVELASKKLAPGVTTVSVKGELPGADFNKFNAMVEKLIDQSNQVSIVDHLIQANFPEQRWVALKNRLQAASKEEREAMFSLITPKEQFNKLVWDEDWMGAVKKLLSEYAKTAKVKCEKDAEPRVLSDQEKAVILSEQKKEYFDPSDFTFELSGVDNISFGIEICADHGVSRLAYALKNTPMKNKVDIHLVASAGMCIEEKSIAAADGGYVFNCDGWNISSGRGQNSNIVVNEVSFSDNSKQMTFKPHSEVRKVGSKDQIKPDQVTQVKIDYPSVAEIFPKGAGNLHIYPLLDLPKKK